MNVYLIQFVAKIFNLLLASFLTLVGAVDNDLVANEINNDNYNKNLNLVNEVIEYETITEYDSSIPTGITNVIQKGVKGLSYESNGEQKVLVEKKDEIVAVGTGKIGIYSGVLTAYGYDCDTCDGRGIVYCPTYEGLWHSLTKDGITYKDREYGEVRILAADQREFPCGTIIEINNSDYNKTIGIVLDTGAGMKNAYNQGWILIDMAYESEATLTVGTNRNTSFTVLRWGW